MTGLYKNAARLRSKAEALSEEADYFYEDVKEADQKMDDMHSKLTSTEFKLRNLEHIEEETEGFVSVFIDGKVFFQGNINQMYQLKEYIEKNFK
ncbi:MAG: hypothetical protein COB15_09495 [Flavobacteriales bacterium]|nr:MAG: hypothetical protein COB15_09495 [Flavobacteriales bacterium]